MAGIEIPSWWKATEIPLVETDWRNIRLYCNEDENPFDWDRCLYVVRLAPPYCIVYGEDCEIETPVVYIGSGVIANRWATHREWLFELGYAIPGGRYEVWICRPRCRNVKALYEDIEADILDHFRTKCGYLPLRNLRIEGTLRQHEYAPGFFDKIIEADRRYLWAMYPVRGAKITTWYSRGAG